MISRPLNGQPSISAISSAVSVKPPTAALRVIRSGVIDFGITTISCCEVPAQHHPGRVDAVRGGDPGQHRVARLVVLNGE